MLTLGLLGGGVAIAIAVWITGSYELFRDPTVRYVRHHSARVIPSLMRSSPVRWWRLRSLAMPDLAHAVTTRDYDATVVEYSWSGGFGPGDVALRLEGNGNCVLTLSSRRPKAVNTYRAHVPASRVDEIMSTIHGAGLLRLLPEDRGYYISDVGRTDIVVTVAGVSRDVIIDTVRTIDDSAAFGKAEEAIFSLKRELGVALDWGPYAWTIGPSPD